MAKERKKNRDVAPGPEAVEVEIKTTAAPSGFVRVRNMGARAWIGSDYPPGKVGSIAPGAVEEMTEQRAIELLKDYAQGASGVGPFEIVRG